MSDPAPLRGVMPLVPTPFDESDRIDESSLRSLIEHYVSAGVHGLTLLGVASEVLKLDDAECREVVEIAIDQAAGRVPIVVGTGYPGTQVAIRRSEWAQSAGAVGVLVLPPYAGQRPGAEALFDYFGAIARSVSIPVVVLDEPSSTLVELPTTLLVRLAAEAGIRHVKVEALPTVRKMAELRAHGIDVLSGTGGLYFLEELEAGSVGAMTGFSFIEVLMDVFNAWVSGDRDTSARIFNRYLPVLCYEMQPVINLPLRKQILQWRGIISTARLRAPADGLDGVRRASIAWKISSSW